MESHNKACGKPAVVNIVGRHLIWPLLSLTLSACGGSSLTDTEHLERARQHFQHDELRASAIELKNALQKNPNLIEARTLLGTVYTELGDGAGAESELRKALKLGADPRPSLPVLGRALLLQGKFNDALEEIQVAEGDSRQDGAQLHALRGTAYLALRDIGSARNSFETALSLQPENTLARMGQVRLALMEGQDKRASMILEGLQRDHADNAEVWSLQGDWQMQVGDLAAAKEAFEKAIEQGRRGALADRLKLSVLRLHLKEYEAVKGDIEALKRYWPRHPAGYYVEGLARFTQGLYREAQSALEEALAREDYLPALFYLGATHYALQNWEQAKHYLQRVVAIQPEADQARKLLAATYARDGEHGELQELLQPVLARNPDDVTSLNLLGGAYLAQGKRHEGLETLQRAVELSPGSSVNHLRLGMALLTLGERAQGLEQMQTALELDPELVAADVLMVLNHLQHGEFDQAQAAVEQVRARQPDSLLALNLEGMIRTAQGQRPQARLAYEAALRRAPGDPTATINLAALLIAEGETNRARELYQKALVAHPKNPDLSLRLAKLEIHSRNTERARELLTQIRIEHPKALEPPLLLAQLAAQLGQPGEALRILEDAQAHHDGAPRLITAMAELQLAMSRAPEALRTVRPLIDKAPDSVSLRGLNARILFRTGDLAGARAELEAAMKLAPRDPRALSLATELAIASHQWEQAADYLERLRNLENSATVTALLSGQLALAQGQTRQAQQAFRRVMEVQPTAAAARGLATAYWQDGQLEAARREISAWLIEHPDDKAMRMAEAELQLVSNQTGAAIKSYERLLKQSPNDPVLLNNLAYLYGSNRDLDKALDYIDRAYLIAPESAEILDTYGWLLTGKGELTRAVELLKKAVGKAPGNPTIRFHHAVALSQTGEAGQAVEILKELSAGPKFPEQSQARALLGRL